MLLLAELPRIGTALAESAAGRPICRRWNRSGDHIESRAWLAKLRHRVHQAFSVWMMRGTEQSRDICLLDYFSAVHHDDSRRSFRNHAEVVCDHQNRSAEFLLKID